MHSQRSSLPPTESPLSPFFASVTQKQNRMPENFGFGSGGTSSGRFDRSFSSTTLKDEFANIEHGGVEGASLENQSLVERTCVVKIVVGTHSLLASLYFPNLYPHQASPDLVSMESTLDLSITTKVELKRSFRETAQPLILSGKPCLVPCLSALLRRFRTIVRVHLKQSGEDLIAPSPPVQPISGDEVPSIPRMNLSSGYEGESPPGTPEGARRAIPRRTAEDTQAKRKRLAPRSLLNFGWTGQGLDSETADDDDDDSIDADDEEESVKSFGAATMVQPSTATAGATTTTSSSSTALAQASASSTASVSATAQSSSAIPPTAAAAASSSVSTLPQGEFLPPATCGATFTATGQLVWFVGSPARDVLGLRPFDFLLTAQDDDDNALFNPHIFGNRVFASYHSPGSSSSSSPTRQMLAPAVSLSTRATSGSSTTHLTTHEDSDNDDDDDSGDNLETSRAPKAPADTITRILVPSDIAGGNPGTGPALGTTDATDATTDLASRRSHVNPRMAVGPGKGANAGEQDAFLVFLTPVEQLMPYSREMASRLVVAGSGMSAFEVCRTNHAAMAHARRPELTKLWSLVAMTVRALTDMANRGNPESWVVHPFGQSLVNMLCDSLIKSGDVQTLALMLCALKTAIDDADVRLATAEEEMAAKSVHSAAGVNFLHHSLKLPPSNNTLLGSPEHKRLHDVSCIVYADLLFRWGLVSAQAQVLKHVDMRANLFDNKTIRFDPPRAPCGLCMLPTHGLSVFCVECGHGGHLDHIKHWFATHPMCPTGCGCACPTVQLQ